MIRTAVRPRILVVGAGLAGTATAIRLLCFARGPLEVVLLERRADYRCAGVAYHRDGNPWDHVFNVQAGRMSAFREDVLDFVRWANVEADRSGWPAPWSDFEFVEQGPAPRRIFQDYLAERLEQARQEALVGVVLVEADGEAVDLDVRADGVEVTVRGYAPRDQEPESGAVAGARAGAGAGAGARAGDAAADAAEVLWFDEVILATGLELREPPFAAGVLGHAAFVRDPYSAAGIRTLAGLAPEATVAIVGSVLSAYDSAALLLRQGHTGTIHLISGSGTIFRTYPEDHEHDVVRLPCPRDLLKPYRDREEFLARLRSEWDAACAAVARDHPDIDPAVVTERVAKAWEPYCPEVIEQIPSAELRSLLDEFGTAISALRVCAVEYTMSVIDHAMLPSDGRVRLVVGRVGTITPGESGRLAVGIASPESQDPQIIEADLVVSNFAREPDYGRVTQPLWRNLQAKGLAVPHRRTGRGVEVDAHGRLLGRDGEPIGPVFAAGVPREGDEIVRNGRTGAFAFNLATIKNQSITVAAHALELLELGKLGEFDDGRRAGTDESADVSAGESVGESADPEEFGNIGQAVRTVFDEAVVLEVRRLATRARAEREQLAARLDARIRSLGGPRAAAAAADASRRERLVRAAVNRAAVERLTDVSVTPRQLRRRLGLAGIEHPEG
ncbi:putative NAD(P)/FAD-binding protein YdhS [Catenulispora sp. EB89]|uniref:FAD/NAD(P)-binding protein n=1 Tax=Catenulispora sp. EB89 TaxID=3156257 RepID=UPI003513BB85